MNHAASSTHIILIGPMGAGKSTLGRALSEALGLPFFDSDAEIERDRGMTGAAIAERDGVDRLHEIELEVFLAAAAGRPPYVISPAESVIDTEDGREALNANTTIWVDADHETLLSRRTRGAHRRTMTTDEFAKRRNVREPHLAVVSDLRLNTASSSVTECVATVCQRVGAQL